MTAHTTTPSLQAETRTQTGKKNRALRRDGKIPAVVYGSHKESRSLSLNAHDFTLLYRSAGNSTLIDLSVDGEKAQKVLVHELQKHPATSLITHVDFFQVNMKEKLTTEISLRFIGEAPAVTLEGGSLIVVKDALEVECLPQDLVSEIEVDISSLATFEDSIRVNDIVLPTGLTLLDDGEETVASVAEPRSEEELAELDEAPVEAVEEVVSETGNEPVTEEEAAPEKE